MFAFCLLDLNKKHAFIARDHLGIKPLQYRLEKDYFAFCSEIYPLTLITGAKPTGSLQALDHYLTYQYIPDPDTIYKSVYKLPPGYYLRVNLDGEIIEKKQYWDVNFSPTPSDHKEDWKALTEREIEDAVLSNLVADVPLGVLLSGGVDSTIISYYMAKILDQPIDAFTISFGDSVHDELKYAKQVADKLGMKLHHEKVEQSSLDVLNKLVNYHYGEPFGDNSLIPTYFVSQLARKHVPMVLSGDGGDEAFAGYHSYAIWHKNHPKNHIKDLLNHHKYGAIPRYTLGTSRKLIRNKFSFNFEDEWQSNITICDDSFRSRIWKAEFQSVVYTRAQAFHEAHANGLNKDRISYAQSMDMKTYMQASVLRKVDIASMANGLEVRPPLLDIKLSKLFFNLPENEKIGNQKGLFQGKYLLKQILSKHFSGDFVNRPKQGFYTPGEEWFVRNGEFRDHLKKLLFSESSALRKFFRLEDLEKIFHQQRMSVKESKIIWIFMTLEIWLENNKISFEL